MVQVLLPTSDAIFQDDSLPTQTARSVQSCFEEQEDAFHHLLWLAQTPNLNIVEPLVSFREQILSIISQATIRRAVQYATGDPTSY